MKFHTTQKLDIAHCILSAGLSAEYALELLFADSNRREVSELVDLSSLLEVAKVQTDGRRTLESGQPSATTGRIPFRSTRAGQRELR